MGVLWVKKMEERRERKMWTVCKITKKILNKIKLNNSSCHCQLGTKISIYLPPVTINFLINGCYFC